MLALESFPDPENYQNQVKFHLQDKSDIDQKRQDDYLRSNLMLSIVRRMIIAPSDSHERYCVRNTTTNQFHLFAIRTPPMSLILGYGDAESTDLLAEHFIDQFTQHRSSLPGVIGRKELVEVFCSKYLPATHLSEQSRMRQLLHVLVEYEPPKRVVSGHYMQANEENKEMLVNWMIQFAIDAKLSDHERTREYAEGLVSSRLKERSVYLWALPPSADGLVDGRPTSVAFASLCDEDMVRIGMVFTPLEDRNHGYASILVNLLSKYFLDQGKKCLLYTDADNPISNSIYYQIGYRAISEELIVKFTQA